MIRAVMRRSPASALVLGALLVLLVLVGTQAQPLDAASTPAAQSANSAPFSIRLEQVAEGFSLPQGAVPFPDGSSRLLVLERAGLLRVV